MSDRINLSNDDFKRKSFKTAPGGTYVAKITAKSKIKPGSKGNNLNVHAKIVKGPHKGITFFDNIAPHVGWKVAQLLNAIGKKLKKLTLQQLLKLAVAAGNVRVQIRQEKFNGKMQNKVVSWLPLKGAEVDDDEAEEQDEDEELDEDEAEEAAEDEAEDEAEESDDEDAEEDEDEAAADEDEDEDEESADDEEEEPAEEDEDEEAAEDEEEEPAEDEDEDKPKKKRSKRDREAARARREKRKKKKSRR